jgi:hypothetical protein
MEINGFKDFICISSSLRGPLTGSNPHDYLSYESSSSIYLVFLAES